MPQSSRMIVTRWASCFQRATSGRSAACRADEVVTTARTSTSFVRQRLLFKVTPAIPALLSLGSLASIVTQFRYCPNSNRAQRSWGLLVAQLPHLPSPLFTEWRERRIFALNLETRNSTARGLRSLESSLLVFEFVGRGYGQSSVAALIPHEDFFVSVYSYRDDYAAAEGAGP